MVELTAESGDMDLLEKLPVHTPLTVDELRKIAKAKLGLMSTNPLRAEAEMKEGVVGDYIILSDLSHLVEIPTIALEKFAKEMEGGAIQKYSLQEELYREALAQLAIKGDQKERFQEILQLIDVSAVPAKYETALHSFISRPAMSAIPYHVTDKTTLKMYIDDLIIKASPALLVIQSSTDIGYDYMNYFGLAKRGKGHIPSESFIARTGLANEDVVLLSRRYEKYLDKPGIAQRSISNQPEISLYQRIDRDISHLLLGNTITTVRGILRNHPSVVPTPNR